MVSSAEIQSQLRAFPIHWRVWFGWLGLVVLILPFAFLRYRAGRVAALISAVFVAGLLVLVHTYGITYLISWLHLVVWGPLFAYLVRELRTGRAAVRSAFGVWMRSAVVTLAVSLAFDVRDAVRWLAGDRGIVAPESGMEWPWVTTVLLAAAAAIAAWAVRNPGRGDES